MHCKVCDSKSISKKFSLEEFEILRCAECGLVFLSYMPTEEDLVNTYSSDYYLEREEYYFRNIINDPDSGLYDENIASFSAGLAKLNSYRPDRGKILDIGCGPGIFLCMARKDGWETYGVDVSPYAVKYAREKFSLEVFSCGKLGDAALMPETFDAVTLWDSLEHFPDPLAQLRSIHSVMKDNGLLMLDVPNEASLLRVIARTLYFATGGGIKYPVRKLYHIYHLYYFSLRPLETLLRKAGFRIASVESKSIPIVKARGSSFEKTLVKLFSSLERGTGMAYELLVTARKNGEKV